MSSCAVVMRRGISWNRHCISSQRCISTATKRFTSLNFSMINFNQTSTHIYRSNSRKVYSTKRNDVLNETSTDKTFTETNVNDSKHHYNATSAHTFWDYTKQISSRIYNVTKERTTTAVYWIGTNLSTILCLKLQNNSLKPLS